MSIGDGYRSTDKTKEATGPYRGTMSTSAVGEQNSRAVGEPNEGVTQDVAFTVLSCRRRRYVLHYLAQADGEVTLNELSTQLAAWENDVSPEAVTYKQRMRLYTALRQSHLPKMDDSGVVDFDSSAGTVALTESASELEVYLDVVPHDEIPWSAYYLGLGLICAGLVAVAWAGVYPISLVPGTGIATLVTTLYTGSAIAHRYHERQNRLGAPGEPPA